MLLPARADARLCRCGLLGIRVYQGIYRAIGEERRNQAEPDFSDHCFTGDYPMPITDLTFATPRGLALPTEAD